MGYSINNTAPSSMMRFSINSTTFGSTMEYSIKQSYELADWLWVERDAEDAGTGDLRYRHPHEQNMVGVPLAVTSEQVQNIMRPLATTALSTNDALSPAMMSSFVFVTGASSQYFHSVRATIARIQRLFQNKTIIFYDLGLLAWQHKKVTMNI